MWRESVYVVVLVFIELPLLSWGAAGRPWEPHPGHHTTLQASVDESDEHFIYHEEPGAIFTYKALRQNPFFSGSFLGGVEGVSSDGPPHPGRPYHAPVRSYGPPLEGPPHIPPFEGPPHIPPLDGPPHTSSLGGPPRTPSLGGPRHTPPLGGPRHTPPLGGPRHTPPLGGPPLKQVQASPQTHITSKQPHVFPTEGAGGCENTEGFHFAGQTWYTKGCRRRTCVHFRGSFIIETDSCDSEIYNTTYKCIVQVDINAHFPDCCPKYYCNPDNLGNSVK